MSNAVVFGGGGPVGIAWESGLVVGLARNGVDLATADRVVGTSAGSVVGARLASGGDLARAAEELEVRSAAQSAESEARPGGTAEQMQRRLGKLMEIMVEVAEWDGPPEEARARLGRFALDADTIPEERFVGFFADLAGLAWPAGFACTAIDAHTGEFRVWDEESRVDLELAVASSCAVPGIYPPVSIRDNRYLDGGMRSPLNADLASGAERVLVVTVMASTMPGSTVTDEAAALRDDGTRVEVIEPDDAFLELTGGGMHLMDSSRAGTAFGLGAALAGREHERIAELWA